MIGLIIAQISMLAIGLWAFAALHRSNMSPQRPSIWLLLIAASLLPTLVVGLTGLRPETGQVLISVIPSAVFDTISQTASSLPNTVKLPNLPCIQLYFGVAAFLFARQLIALIKLHRLSGVAVPEQPFLLLTDKHLPPFALGGPRRRIVVSNTLWEILSKREQAMLLAHERCHLAHRDPEMTLGLLALQSLFWLNPGFRLLVIGWREAIERRADAAVVRNHAPRDYAQLFTRLARTAANLPVPTQSKPRSQGDFVMRLHTILNPETHVQPASKPTLGVILGLSLAASLGTSIASASPTTVEPTIIKRVPPAMPASCPELTSESVGDIRILADEITQGPDGMRTRGGSVDVGTVNLQYDVDAAGVPQNIIVTSANAPCFRAPSIASVGQWLYVPNEPATGIETQIKYRLTLDDGKTVQESLDAFWGNTDP